MIELYAVNAGYRKRDVDTNWYYVSRNFGALCFTHQKEREMVV